METQESISGNSGWRASLANLLTAGATADPERSSIWSVPRPFIRLYLVLFSIQSGWLISVIIRDVLKSHGSGGLGTIAYETLNGLSQPGVGAAIASLLVVEGISYIMVMYNFLMYYLVRPVIKRHERRGEARGEARASQRWEEWNQRREEAEVQGVAFTEPPPSHQPENQVPQ